jgi:RHH-type proline utilization regulon transcriptional repressor/proline dehydrogenase/delta 1-pyrroline-5-carboxylate dehydrogenase
MTEAVGMPAGQEDLESAIRTIGREIAEAFPPRTLHPVRVLDERLFARLGSDRELRAAMFRFVDVAPACRSKADLAAHLVDQLRVVESKPLPLRLAYGLARLAPLRPLVGAGASAGVSHVARRFIAGRTPERALHLLGRLWRHDVASTLDLLGEATLTVAEAESYATRCAEALQVMSAGSSRWPPRPRLETDSLGALPRVNLSVKLTGLAPLLHPDAPEVGAEEAAPRLRALLRLARDLGAHLQIDMESLDTRETTLALALELLGEEEFSDGPSAGLVLQAYLVDAGAELDQILRWADHHRRSTPLTVRLVKGAYWDYEVATARQHGRQPPVHTDKAACDSSFESLTRSLLEARPLVRVAIASHNLRSLAHAIAANRASESSDTDVELQVLRGLGDDLEEALSSLGFRVRAYCPVGELVEGMAYFVRRLLENTSNESFVHRQAVGESLEVLLARP